MIYIFRKHANKATEKKITQITEGGFSSFNQADFEITNKRQFLDNYFATKLILLIPDMNLNFSLVKVSYPSS